jgi:hypothetical protein
MYYITNPDIMNKVCPLPACGMVSPRFLNIESMIGWRGLMCILVMGDNALVSLVRDGWEAAWGRDGGIWKTVVGDVVVLVVD